MTCPCPAESKTTHWRGWGTVREGFMGSEQSVAVQMLQLPGKRVGRERREGRGILEDGVSIHSPEREGSTQSL